MACDPKIGNFDAHPPAPPFNSVLGPSLPALVAAEGENASLRFLDFFTANIRNPNTRAAYAVVVRAFSAWLDAKHVVPLGAVRTHHVSTYVASRSAARSDAHPATLALIKAPRQSRP
jgi:hypothetical protein